mmetsp:Transcript_22555/g.31404  ORF Transcript_22555/g.31404 Transcript_22555/m.31404 type:complete len:169 (-) Transcript_22555:63-569(-)
MGRAKNIQDCYDLLGISKKSSSKQVKDAYKHLARQLHPDMVPPADRNLAEVDFKRLSDAYTRVRQDQLGPSYWSPALHRSGSRHYPAMSPRPHLPNSALPLRWALFLSIPAVAFALHVSTALHEHQDLIAESTGRRNGLLNPPTNPFLSKDRLSKTISSPIYQMLFNK